MKIFFVTLFSFFLLLIIGYQVGELTLKKLDEEARENFDGNFIKTELGTLCYKFHGPKDGEIILLIHGWSYPKNVFDNNIQALTRNGFRVLTFDQCYEGLQTYGISSILRKVYSFRSPDPLQIQL